MAVHLRDQHIFMWQPTTKDFEHFQCFNFEISFLKNQNFLKKTGISF